MPPTLQTPAVFLSDFIKQARKATKRIWLQSMNFESGEMLSQLEPALIAQAEAGVEVIFHIDWVAKRFIHGHLPLLPVIDPTKRAYQAEVAAKNLAARDRMIKSGVKFVEVNVASPISYIFPTFRRNHIKLYVIDDHLSWIGGINLLDRAFTCHDFMVRYDDPAINQIAAEQFLRINRSRLPQNQALPLSSTDTLLVDAGKIGNSIIYGQALELIKTAQTKITFISQFVPEGRILRALLDATKDGVEVEIITSHLEAVKRWSTAHQVAYQLFQRRLRQYPIVTFRHAQERVHAKLLLVDGHRALFGSHNMVDTGVLMGTEEIAVRTDSMELVHQLVKFSGQVV